MVARPFSQFADLVREGERCGKVRESEYLAELRDSIVHGDFPSRIRFQKSLDLLL